MTIAFLAFGAIMRFKIVIYLTNPNFIRFFAYNGGFNMDEILSEIIKSDELAREKIKQAVEYRTKQMAQLPQKKEELEKSETEKIVSEAVKRRNASAGAADKKLEQLKVRSLEAEKKMNELLKEKGAEWVDRIVDGVING